MQIIPSILVQSAEAFITQTNAVQNSVKLVHIDIADGKCVPNTTWAEPNTVQQNLTIDCELHLMVVDPLSVIQMWGGVSSVKRVLFPIEYDGDIIDVIDTIHHHGWQAGLVINLETSTLMIEPFIDKLDSVMFMGIIPGKQGQPFVPEVLEKITEFKARHPKIFVALDGGVNEKTLPEIVATGIDAVCCGSVIFHNERTPNENIIRLQNLI